MNHLQGSCQRASHLKAESMKNCRKFLSCKVIGQESFFRSIFGFHFRKVCRLLTIRCNAMLETVELPAGVANLDPGLPDMDGETLPHDADQTWWIVGSEAGARCAADPRLSRGGGEGSRWRSSRKSRVRPGRSRLKQSRLWQSSTLRGWEASMSENPGP